MPGWAARPIRARRDRSIRGARTGISAHRHHGHVCPADSRSARRRRRNRIIVRNADGRGLCSRAAHGASSRRSRGVAALSLLLRNLQMQFERSLTHGDERRRLGAVGRIVERRLTWTRRSAFQCRRKIIAIERLAHAAFPCAALGASQQSGRSALLQIRRPRPVVAGKDDERVSIASSVYRCVIVV